MADVTAELAREYNLSESTGGLILDAGPNSELLQIGAARSRPPFLDDRPKDRWESSGNGL